MKSLLLDLINPPSQLKTYPLMGNISRINQYNIEKQFQHILSMPYNNENQNVLVGVLQNLSIDKNWDLDYVVAYARLRSSSICSAFNISSASKNAVETPNVIYYGGCNEHLCLLDTDKVYNNDVAFKDLLPLIPLYTSFALYSYNSPVERYKNSQLNLKNEYAILGLNIVDLAVGWWLFMNDSNFDTYGIHSYIAKIVATRFSLLSNELSLFNAVYNYYVNQTSNLDMLLDESVVFNTMAYQNGLEKYLNYLIVELKEGKFKGHRGLISYFEGKLTPNLDLLFDANRYTTKYHENIIWCLEANQIKYLLLYFTILNDRGSDADGIKSSVLQNIPLIMSRYKRIKNVKLKEHLIKLLNDLYLQTKIN